MTGGKLEILIFKSWVNGILGVCTLGRTTVVRKCVSFLGQGCVTSPTLCQNGAKDYGGHGSHSLDLSRGFQ